MSEYKRPYHDGMSFPTANEPGITPESAYVDGYLAAMDRLDTADGAFRIDDDGKASDMDASTVMSGDGCNPVNRDSEMERAHDDAGPLIPGILPGAMPGEIPGAFPGAVPPAYFPGNGFRI